MRVSHMDGLLRNVYSASGIRMLVNGASVVDISVVNSTKLKPPACFGELVSMGACTGRTGRRWRCFGE